MGSSNFGSLVNNTFDLPDPDFVGQSEGLIDPRKRLTSEDVAGKRKRRIKKLGEFKPLTPGQDLELRGFNEFQDARRRNKQDIDSLEGEANQVGLSDAVARSRREAGEATESEAASLRRRQSGLGLRLSDRQKSVQRRRIGLGRAVNEASAAGATRRSFASNAQAARRGGVGLEDNVFNAENAGLTQLANAAGQNKQRSDNMIAQREQDRAGFLGGVGGIVASFFSSEDFKHDKTPATGLLDKLKAVRVENWKYRGDDHTNHIGPYAQEFNDTFGVGQDDKQKISVVDMLGVTLGAVKELSERVNG